MIRYRKSLKYYISVFIFILASIYIVWVLGQLFITNITVNKPSSNSFKIYQNSFIIKPIPIYILQLGVYNDIRTAQNDAKKFSSKGVVTYLTNHDSYRLITDIYTQEAFLYQKKAQVEKKGLSTFVSKSLILNDKQYLLESEKEIMHNQLNKLFSQYADWLKNSELFWVEKEKLSKPTAKESPIQKNKEQFLNEYNQLMSLLNSIIQDVKEEKLKIKLENLAKITTQYKDNFTNIDNGIESKGANLAKGQLLACWDHFQYLYEYIGDDRKVINESN